MALWKVPMSMVSGYIYLIEAATAEDAEAVVQDAIDNYGLSGLPHINELPETDFEVIYDLIEEHK